MAGPVFRAIGARSQSAGAASIAPAKPTVDGVVGLLLCVVTSKNNGVHATATPGWSLLNQTNNGASFTASLWVAAETAAAPTFTWTGSVACSAHIAYYTDPANTMNIGSSVIGTAGTGLTATHSSTAIVTDVNDALAVYVDVAATNTSLTTPSGWTSSSDTGSATDAGRTSFGSKAVATSGTSSGAISTTGANAAWVQWQLELKGSAPASAFQVSKVETAGWIEPPDGFDTSKLETAAWYDAAAGFGASKLETAAWLDSQVGFIISKMESGAWLDHSAHRRRQIVN